VPTAEHETFNRLEFERSRARGESLPRGTWLLIIVNGELIPAKNLKRGSGVDLKPLFLKIKKQSFRPAKKLP